MSVRYGEDLEDLEADDSVETGYDGEYDEEYDSEYDGPDFGPFDVAKLDPEMTDALTRLDFGAVQVPIPPQGSVVEPEDGARLSAVHITMPGGGRLSLSALAAPRSGGLWKDLCEEIAQSLREGGATVRSYTGEWGRELRATTQVASSVFVGIDGERWMVYGVAAGPEEQAERLDAEMRRMLRGTIVVRGKSPYPPRTVLPLTLPSAVDEAPDPDAEAPQPKATLTLRTRSVTPAAEAGDAAEAAADAPADPAGAPAGPAGAGQVGAPGGGASGGAGPIAPAASAGAGAGGPGVGAPGAGGPGAPQYGPGGPRFGGAEFGGPAGGPASGGGFGGPSVGGPGFGGPGFGGPGAGGPATGGSGHAGPTGGLAAGAPGVGGPASGGPAAGGAGFGAPAAGGPFGGPATQSVYTPGPGAGGPAGQAPFGGPAGGYTQGPGTGGPAGPAPFGGPATQSGYTPAPGIGGPAGAPSAGPGPFGGPADASGAGFGPGARGGQGGYAPGGPGGSTGGHGVPGGVVDGGRPGSSSDVRHGDVPSGPYAAAGPGPYGPGTGNVATGHSQGEGAGFAPTGRAEAGYPGAGQDPRFGGPGAPSTGAHAGPGGYPQAGPGVPGGVAGAGETRALPVIGRGAGGPGSWGEQPAEPAPQAAGPHSGGWATAEYRPDWSAEDRADRDQGSGEFRGSGWSGDPRHSEPSVDQASGGWATNGRHVDPAASRWAEQQPSEPGRDPRFPTSGDAQRPGWATEQADSPRHSGWAAERQDDGVFGGSPQSGLGADVNPSGWAAEQRGGSAPQPSAGAASAPSWGGEQQDSGWAGGSERPAGGSAWGTEQGGRFGGPQHSGPAAVGRRDEIPSWQDRPAEQQSGGWAGGQAWRSGNPSAEGGRPGEQPSGRRAAPEPAQGDRGTRDGLYDAPSHGGHVAGGRPDGWTPTVHQPPGPGYETVDRDSGRLPQYGYTASGWSSQGGGREVAGFAGVRTGPGSPADVPTSLFDALMAESADHADHRPAARNGYGPVNGHAGPGGVNGHDGRNGWVGPNGHGGAPGHGAPNGHGGLPNHGGPNSGGIPEGPGAPNGYGAPNGHGPSNGYRGQNGHVPTDGHRSQNGFGGYGHDAPDGHVGPGGYGSQEPGLGEPEPGGNRRHGEGRGSRPALSFLDADPLNGVDPDRGRHRRPE